MKNRIETQLYKNKILKNRKKTFTNINKMTNHLSSQLLNIKNSMTYANGNPGPGLGQAQKCGRVKLVNRIPTIPVLIIRSPTAIQK
jgi:hypothetical protein